MPPACGSRCRQDTGSVFSPSLCPECYAEEVTVLTAATNEHPPFPPLRLSAGTQWHQGHHHLGLTAEPPPRGPALPKAQSSVAVAAWISRACRLPPGKVTGCAWVAGQVGGHVWALFQAWSTCGGSLGSLEGRVDVGRWVCRLLTHAISRGWWLFPCLATEAETRVEACWCHILT